MPLPIYHLPVVQNWDCHVCGTCCKEYQVGLTDEERRKAPIIHQTLLSAVERLRAGERDFDSIERSGIEALDRSGFRPDYFVVRRADDLGSPDASTRQLVVLTAARLGRARLIDNLQLGT